MTEQSALPRGGTDPRKYAALYFALGLARGALMEAMAGHTDDAPRILDVTATARIAQALGCRESDLAVDWAEHLTPDELRRLRG